MIQTRCLLRTLGCAAVLSVAAGLLSGCAELALVNSVAILASGPTADPSRDVETNRRTFTYPVSAVYDALLVVVERDGRKIVTSDPSAHRLDVAYPFSWLHNNWGGVITVTCTVDESAAGGSATSVQVVGGARDAHFRIRKIGDSILEDLAGELGRSGALHD